MKHRDVYPALAVMGEGDYSRGGVPTPDANLSAEGLSNIKRRIEKYIESVIHAGCSIPAEVSSVYFKIDACLKKLNFKKKS